MKCIKKLISMVLSMLIVMVAFVGCTGDSIQTNGEKILMSIKASDSLELSELDLLNLVFDSLECSYEKVDTTDYPGEVSDNTFLFKYSVKYTDDGEDKSGEIYYLIDLDTNKVFKGGYPRYPDIPEEDEMDYYKWWYSTYQQYDTEYSLDASVAKDSAVAFINFGVSDGYTEQEAITRYIEQYDK
ncbi:MAG: hypothetical protein J1E41_01305 [Ruminococcus sp.]|nr:hypothetical protein [Ruminococcus sp.]